MVYLKEGKFYSTRDPIAPVYEPESDADAAYIEFQINRLYQQGQQQGQVLLATVAQDNKAIIETAEFLGADQVVLTGTGFRYFSGGIWRMTAEVALTGGPFSEFSPTWEAVEIVGSSPESDTRMVLYGMPNHDSFWDPLPKALYFSFRLKLNGIVFCTSPITEDGGGRAVGILPKIYPTITAAELEAGGTAISAAGGENVIVTGTGFLRAMVGSKVELRDNIWLNPVEAVVNGYNDTQVFITTPATPAGNKIVAISRDGLMIAASEAPLLTSA